MIKVEDMKDLYNITQINDNKIKDSGYNLVTCWEHDSTKVWQAKYVLMNMI